jgi:8-oxo-dGTP diphosphatase
MKTVDVVCAVIWKEGKILVAQRSEKMSLPLKWEFPGGKLEVGESEEECLHRELKEELNISVKILARMHESIYDYDGFRIRLIPFEVEYVGGEILLAEHRDVKTFSKEEMRELDWAMADRPILQDFFEYSS